MRLSPQDNDTGRSARKEDTRERWRRYGKRIRGPLSYSAVGLEFGLSVVIAYFAGTALDDWLGTKPWMLFSLVILGVVSSFYSLYRTVKRALEEMDD